MKNKKNNGFMLGVSIILLCSCVFFMSYMRIDSDEIDSLYKSYFRTYKAGDFRSISSAIVSWESYVGSFDNEGNKTGHTGMSSVDRGSLLSILEAMADFYINEIGVYVSSTNPKDYFFCNLIDTDVRADCSGFATAYASLVSNTALPIVNSHQCATALPRAWEEAGWKLYSVSEIDSIEVGDIMAFDGHVEVSLGARGTFGWGAAQTQFPSQTTAAEKVGDVIEHGSKTYTHVVRYVGATPNFNSGNDNTGITLPSTSMGSDWKKSVEEHYGNTGRSSNWKSVTHLGRTYAWEKQSGYNHTAVDSNSSLTGAGCLWFSIACCWTTLSGEVHGVDDCLEALGYTVDRSNVTAFTISPRMNLVGMNANKNYNGVKAVPDELIPAITGYTTVDKGTDKSFVFGTDKLYLVHVIEDKAGYLSQTEQHWFLVIGEDGTDYLLLNASGDAAKRGNKVSKDRFNAANINHIYEITK